MKYAGEQAMWTLLRHFEIEHVNSPSSLRIRRTSRSVFPFSSVGRWWQHMWSRLRDCPFDEFVRDEMTDLSGLPRA